MFFLVSSSLNHAVVPRTLCAMSASPHFFGRTCHGNRGSLGTALACCDSAPPGEIQLGAEVGTASSSADPPPRASPSVSAESWVSHQCAVWCKTCGNLCFTLAPSSAQGWTPARVPKPLPCLGSPQAAVAASFKVQVQYCCNSF